MAPQSGLPERDANVLLVDAGRTLAPDVEAAGGIDRVQTDEFIDLLAELVTSLERRHGDGNNHLRSPMAMHRFDCGGQVGFGSQPVVNQNNGAPHNGLRWAAAAKEDFVSIQLFLFRRRGRKERLKRDPGVLDYVFIG